MGVELNARVGLELGKSSKIKKSSETRGIECLIRGFYYKKEVLWLRENKAKSRDIVEKSF